MKFLMILLLVGSTVFSSIHSQVTMRNDSVPYFEIPTAPEGYSVGSVFSRMIDGLGFRYYWGSKSLSDDDLKYKPTEEARSTLETIEHIYDLSLSILNISEGKPSSGLVPEIPNGYENLRSETLRNLYDASLNFRFLTDEEVAKLVIVFQNGDHRSEFPLWNLINGQIADAIYHTGQIVSFRRITGNPINPRVSVFRGNLRSH